ncbi:hypothetical protein OH76DRAFT_310640 [Lentinus brumalis]|uniref:Uncharacterized protein n=1 Tax=Lentinus brumalis TaxID=2498619 RepID=A0A371CK63_9APHY|nr:hypothetical protein OH76DRAFT_310640 [Polyporus brumalis]
MSASALFPRSAAANPMGIRTWRRLTVAVAVAAPADETVTDGGRVGGEGREARTASVDCARRTRASTYRTGAVSSLRVSDQPTESESEATPAWLTRLGRE